MTKYTPLYGALVFAYFAFDVIYNNHNEDGTWFAAAVLMTISAFFYLLFRELGKVFVEVEIDNRQILVKGKEPTIVNWIEVTEIDFTWFGVYRFKFRNQVLFFPPFDISLSIFGAKMDTCEFDRIIEKKKKELGL